MRLVVLCMFAIPFFTMQLQAADEPPVHRYLRAATEVAEKQYQKAREANEQNKGSISDAELDRLRLQVEWQRARLALAESHMQLLELKSQLRQAEYARAVELNRRAPDTVPATVLEKLRTRAEQAKQKAKQGPNLDWLVPDKAEPIKPSK